MKRGATTQSRRAIRHSRIRARVFGTAEKPRLAVYRSNTSVYAQLIDDTTGKTIVAVRDADLEGKTLKGNSKSVRAKLAGALLATRAKEKNISRVVFDRGGFTYTGRVKEFAEGAREGGLQF